MRLMARGGSSSKRRAISPPSQASGQGFTRLVFNDEFDTDAIAPASSSVGNYKWWPRTPGQTSVASSILTMSTDTTTNSGGLQSIPVNFYGNGYTGEHGYFECRMAFDNAGMWTGSNGWPAFWSLDVGEVSDTQIGEIDFMEAIPTPRSAGNAVAIYQTVHQWTAGFGSDTQSTGNQPTLPGPPTFNISTYHKYGCLWTPNDLLWYFDDVAYTHTVIGSGTSWTAPELPQRMFLLLGTGTSWPMKVDWVRVWGPRAATGAETLPNPSLTGGSNGSPGTLPTNMATTMNGLTRTVVASGSSDPIDGLPYVTLQFSGTTTGAGDIHVYFAQANASIGTGEALFTLNLIQTATTGAGNTNVTGFYMEVDAFNGVSFVNTVFAATARPNATRTVESIRGTLGAGTTNAYAQWAFTVAGAVAVNFTVRFSAPSLRLV